MGETAGRTSAEEARRLIGTGKAKALDLHGEDEWQDSHVPGALHVPSAELGSRIEELSEHKRLILVGADDEVERATQELSAQSHEATAPEGGMKSWESEDFPRQPSDDPDGPI
jgi:rhodanese-related sulfurtransferase